MLEHCKSATERWGGVSDLIDKWLKARQNVIVQFCNMTGDKNDLTPEDKAVRYQTFCQTLVDYVSAGHFGVYGELVKEAKEFDDGGLDIANEVIPKIEKTTAIALGFNDRFDEIHKVDDGIRGLEGELEALGKTLEDRFQLEDILIESLHNVHAGSIAS